MLKATKCLPLKTDSPLMRSKRPTPCAVSSLPLAQREQAQLPSITLLILELLHIDKIEEPKVQPRDTRHWLENPSEPIFPGMMPQNSLMPTRQGCEWDECVCAFGYCGSTIPCANLLISEVCWGKIAALKLPCQILPKIAPCSIHRAKKSSWM